MKNTFIVILLSILMSLCLSCSYPDNIVGEYTIEVEHITCNHNQDDSIPNDSTNNDTTNIDVVTKDTIKLSYENYMTITPSYGTAQGAACFGRYLIQGYSSNNVIGIYDLEGKRAIGKLDIPAPAASGSTHANTVNFSKERFSPDDYFPLLYISSGYTKRVNGGAACSFIYVYRISKNNNSDDFEGFKIDLVQTITLNGFGSWTEGIIDNDNNILWIKYEPNGTNGEYRYASFPMPKLENGDVTILKDDNFTDFSLGVQPFTSSNQGHLYHGGKILLVSGTSYKTQKLAFIVINTLTGKRELVIDLADIGLTSEPENVFFYGTQLMIGYSRTICKFNMYANEK